MSADTPMIFLHSLWRSGSTYFFEVFRRNPDRYFAFQEPVHETMLAAVDDPEILKALQPECSERMRHPDLGAGYFEEAYRTHALWKNHIVSDFIYDRYFQQERDEQLEKFFSSLSLNDSDPRRTVVQECRTSGRIGPIKAGLGGVHIYVWRNPWDQWWSYKISDYFSAATQIICNSDDRPQSLRNWSAINGLEQKKFASISEGLRHYAQHPLRPDLSYQGYFLLWAKGWLQAQQHADILINVDTLTENLPYREDMLAQLAERGIEGLNFDDCAIYRAPYSLRDRDFFERNEEAVYDLLPLDGHDHAAVTALKAARTAHSPIGQKRRNAAISRKLAQTSLSRAREVVERIENEMSALALDLDSKNHHAQDAFNNHLTKQLEELNGIREAELARMQQQHEADLQERERVHAARLMEMHQAIESERSKLGDSLRRVHFLQESHSAAMKDQADRSEREFKQAMLAQDEAHRQALNQLYAQMENSKAVFDAWESNLLQSSQELESDLRVLRSAYDRQNLAIGALQAEFTLIERSLSWRLTAIFRKFGLDSRYDVIKASLAAMMDVGLRDKDGRIFAQGGQVAKMGQLDHRGDVVTIDYLFSLPAEAFVRAAYQLILGRAGDEGGIAHYATRLMAGDGRVSILRDLVTSPEGVRHARHDDLLTLDGPALVDQLYRRFLKRAPDKDGMAHFLSALEQHGDKRRMIDAIANSPEALASQSAERRLNAQIRALVASDNRTRTFWRRIFHTRARARKRELNILGEQMTAAIGRVTGGAGYSGTRQEEPATSASTGADRVQKVRRPRRTNAAGNKMLDQLMLQIRKDVAIRKQEAGDTVDGRAQVTPPYDAIAAEVSASLASMK